MKIVIAEDQREDAALLCDNIEKYAEETNKEIEVTVFSSGEDLVEAFSEDWDLLLLDIEMPGMSGLEAARKIREINETVLIMFITRLPHYAIDAFSVVAMDYILKPVNYEMLSMKMDRVCGMLNRKRKRMLIINNTEGAKRIEISEIRYAEIQNHTLTYHCGDESISSTGTKTMKVLEEELDPYGFVRCNKCYLVNLQYVTELLKEQVCLGNVTLKISRRYKNDFVKKLMMYWGEE